MSATLPIRPSAKNPAARRPVSNASNQASSAAPDYAYLRQLVLAHAHNVLDPSRDYLFETHLAPLLRRRGLTRMQDLVQLLRLQSNPVLERQVAEAMTINETSFFRDSRPFELLRTPLLPSLIESRRSTRRLRFWSAACSTGQEAYSLAITLLEYASAHAPALAGWTLRVEGTDISSEVVQRCQAGRYPRIDINRGLPARHILRYFDHHGEPANGDSPTVGSPHTESTRAESPHEFWTVKPELRAITHFRHANLCGDQLPFPPNTPPFDVIFLRNVMIYFARHTRKKLLANIHRILAPDGILFLGSSEQPADPSLWTPTLAGGTCYYRPRRPR